MSSFQRALELSVFLALVLSACSAPHTVVAESPRVAELPPSDVPHSRQADDAARFLAGMEGVPGTPFAALQETETWKEHRRQLDAAWQSTEGELLTGFRKFQTDELSDPALAQRVVFYPFSGPDT